MTIYRTGAAGKFRKKAAVLVCLLGLAMAGTMMPSAVLADAEQTEVTVEAAGSSAQQTGTENSAGDPEEQEDIHAVPGDVVLDEPSCDENSITLTWSTVKGAGSYVVTRQSDTENNPVVLEDSETEQDYVTGTEFVDDDIERGRLYKYTVTAMKNKDGTGLAGTTAETGWIEPQIDVPVLKCLSAGQSAVKLSWNSSELSDNCEWGYYVYRKIAGGSWKRLAVLDSSTVSYTDTAALTIGTSYIYLVRPYVMRGTESDHDTLTAQKLNGSNQVTVKIIPAAPKLTSVTAAVGSNTVKWSAVSNAAKYYVYRRYGTSGSWTRVGTTTTALYFKDTGALPGKVCYYTVKAAVKVGSTLVSGAYDTTGLKVTSKVGTVVLGTLTGTKTFTLTWNAMANVDGYRVYRKVGSGSWTLLGNTDSAEATSWEDSDLEEGGTYTYTVRAYVVDETVTLGAYDKTGLTKQLSVNAPVMLGAVSRNGCVAISWKTTGTADGYLVYRKTGTGSYVALASKGDNSTLNVYWDKNATIGTSYVYGVKAYRYVNGTKVFSAIRAASAVTACPAEPQIQKVSGYSSLTKDQIIWSTVSGVTGYKVYWRNASTGNKWTLLKTVTAGSGTTMELRTARYQGGDTDYLVRSYKTVGSKTIMSPYTSSDCDYVSNAVEQYKNTKILCVGDSITYGFKSGTSTSPVAVTVPYTDRIADITGASVDTVDPATECGRTMTQRKYDTRSLMQEMADGNLYFKGYDVICIALGVNDYRDNCKIGTVSDSSAYTFCGAWNSTMQLLQEQNPTAKIVLITPFVCGAWHSDYSKIGMNSANGIGLTLQDYANAICEIADKYRAEGLDISIYNSAESAKSYGVNAITLTESNYWYRTVDALHPTADTYAKIGNSIAAFLMKNVLAKAE